MFGLFNRRSEAAHQRPFYICPECSAYNARVLTKCWRCEHDLNASALEPRGVLGFRLEQMEKESGLSRK
jgi:ribosomal protein L37AE/L43A